jgi:hypothetical protein
MKINHIASHHRVRLREFFRHTKTYARLHAHDRLFHQMSHQLRGDTALIVGRASLARVWYFELGRVEKEFVAGACRPIHRTFSSNSRRRGMAFRRRVLPCRLTSLRANSYARVCALHSCGR